MNDFYLLLIEGTPEEINLLLLKQITELEEELSDLLSQLGELEEFSPPEEVIDAIMNEAGNLKNE